MANADNTHPHPEDAATAGEGQVQITGLLLKFRADLYAYLLAAVGNHHDADTCRNVYPNLFKLNLVVRQCFQNQIRFVSGTSFIASTNEQPESVTRQMRYGIISVCKFIDNLADSANDRIARQVTVVVIDYMQFVHVNI